MASSKKVAIITGANSGIGLVATRLLCKQDYHVIMACRSQERADQAIAQVKMQVPEASVMFMQLDLNDLSSVREFASKFHEGSQSLHVLVNNAGLFFRMDDTQRQTNGDGFELTMATNHLGHFLLTHLLLDDLKMTASKEGEARVVVVTSRLHAGGVRKPLNPIDIEDLMMEKEGAYNGQQAYKNSKAANVLFTRMLSRRLEGAGVTVNCMCPGFIPGTGLIRHANMGTRFFLNYFLDGVMKVFKKVTRSPEEGGQSIVFLATSDEVQGVTGQYFSDDKVTEPSDEAKDEELQQKLWDLSVKLVRLQASESSQL